jgi:hypothetical protein
VLSSSVRLVADFVDDHCESWDLVAVEGVGFLWVDWDANFACFWMDAPGRLEQVINARRHVGVETRVQIGED